jgi:hypothetical protein
MLDSLAKTKEIYLLGARRRPVNEETSTSRSRAVGSQPVSPLPLAGDMLSLVTDARLRGHSWTPVLVQGARSRRLALGRWTACVR